MTKVINSLMKCFCLFFIIGCAGCVPTGNDTAQTSEPTDLIVTISAEPETIRADGQSIAVVTAKVVDLYGEPVSGISVHLTTSLGSLELFEFSAASNQWKSVDTPPRTSPEGIVYAYLTSSNQIGTAEVIGTIYDSSVKVLVHFL